ncbi:M20/M25/M40 family metallo-hydrolase [Phenylobacterium sp. LjRoot219]|uniref:M20/M25/M40 family metallo-hydrolase n=1 Tax=Phenylobacterium sp. LjRoot219 TaxID=3342283 RepID=UPI003ECEC676
MGRSIALFLALVAGLLFAWSELRLPAVAPADAPLHAFSATRAMADVRRVAAAPHPTGSAANHAVRDRLKARMTELGLAPRLRRDDALGPPRADALYGGTVETLIGVLPGADRSQPALAVMAHYDSVPGAPGAADDGAGVATALEIIRALRAQGVPARDVALILTDGEEAGLLGARGFFAGDPLARRLGFVLNLEARGSGGRVQMFQTGHANGAAIGVFVKTAVRPSAGSLFGEVYARLPNDTDFTLARAAGLGGFNYAFTGRAFDYHSPTDTPQHLQRGALQDMGAQVLAVAEALAFAPHLPEPKPDAVYGVLVGDLMLAYPAAWGWAPLVLAAGLIALALVRARRRRALTWGEVAHGAGAGLYTLAAAVAVLHLAGALAGGGDLGAQRLLAVARRWEAAQLLLMAGVLMIATAEALDAAAAPRRGARPDLRGGQLRPRRRDRSRGPRRRARRSGAGAGDRPRADRPAEGLGRRPAARPRRGDGGAARRAPGGLCSGLRRCCWARSPRRSAPWPPTAVRAGWRR